MTELFVEEPFKAKMFGVCGDSTESAEESLRSKERRFNSHLGVGNAVPSTLREVGVTFGQNAPCIRTVTLMHASLCAFCSSRCLVCFALFRELH